MFEKLETKKKRTEVERTIEKFKEKEALIAEKNHNLTSLERLLLF